MTKNKLIASNRFLLLIITSFFDRLITDWVGLFIVVLFP
jgi:hypothetical protein